MYLYKIGELQIHIIFLFHNLGKNYVFIISKILFDVLQQLKDNEVNAVFK